MRASSIKVLRRIATSSWPAGSSGWAASCLIALMLSCSSPATSSVSCLTGRVTQYQSNTPASRPNSATSSIDHSAVLQSALCQAISASALDSSPCKIMYRYPFSSPSCRSGVALKTFLFWLRGSSPNTGITVPPRKFCIGARSIFCRLMCPGGAASARISPSGETTYSSTLGLKVISRSNSGFKALRSTLPCASRIASRCTICCASPPESRCTIALPYCMLL